MDDQRFDALTRALARGSSRRTALKGLFGSLVGGVAIATRLDRAGAQSCESGSDCNNGYHCCDGTCRECCVADDCDPYVIDQCGIPICDDGICSAVSACTGQGQRCCNSGTPDHYCATCCGDNECGSCQSCIGGTCVDDECCGDSDCYGLCASCTGGTCVSNCGSDEYCCASTNACLGFDQCCSDDDCPCGYCSEGTCYPQCDEHQRCCRDECISIESCCSNNDCGQCAHCTDGTCIPECGVDEECCADNCVAPGTCGCVPPEVPCADAEVDCCFGLTCCVAGETSFCAECCDDSDCGRCEICDSGVCAPKSDCCKTDGDTCAVTDGPGTQGNCCDDLLCCPGGDGGYCAECCDDSDCPSCSHCSNGTCYGECSQSQECCNGECVEDDACCRSEGNTCGVTLSDDSAQIDCCDGLLCCDNLYYGASVCAECCVDQDCPHGGRCDQGECKHVCKNDRQCPEGTCCCNDGSCSGKCCHHPHPHPHPKPPAPTPAAPVTTLPATGAGPNDERNDLLGVLGLGAAAALFAAKQLRDDPDQSEQPAEQ